MGGGGGINPPEPIHVYMSCGVSCGATQWKWSSTSSWKIVGWANPAKLNMFWKWSRAGDCMSDTIILW